MKKSLSLSLMFLGCTLSTAYAQENVELIACQKNAQYDQTCLQTIYAEQDKALNDAYTALMNTVQGENEIAMRNSQRRWLASRDSRCQYSDDAAQRTICLIDQTIQRTQEIVYTQDLMSGLYDKAPKRPFEGQWVSCFTLNQDDKGKDGEEICMSTVIEQKGSQIRGISDEFVSYKIYYDFFEAQVSPENAYMALTPVCGAGDESKHINAKCLNGATPLSVNGRKMGLALCGDHQSRLYIWDISNESDAQKGCDDLMREFPDGGARRDIAIVDEINFSEDNE